MTTRVAIYTRISADAEGRELGVTRQQEDCEARASREGWTVVRVYTDNDTGASNLSRKARPQYAAMIEAARRREFGVILAYSNSRLTRRQREFAELIELHKATGVRICTIVSGDDDLSTADGRMVAWYKAIADAAEAERTGERVARAARQRAEQGRPQGGSHRPFGYHRDGLTVHPVEGPALTEACRDFLTGASLRSIARRWNDRKLYTTSGAHWTAGNLRKVLLRPRNAGLVGARPAHESAMPTIIGTAQWPALVDRDTWEGVVAKLGDPSRKTHNGTSRRLVGAGIFRCGQCGARIRSGGNAYDGQPRYACAGTAKGGSQCLLRRARHIDAHVREVIAGVLTRDGVKLIPQTVDVTAERTRLRALEATAKNLAIMLGEGEIDPASYRTAMRFNEEKRVALQAVIAASAGSSPLNGIADAEDAGAAFLAADTDRQREIINVIASVTVFPTGRGARGFNPNTVKIEPVEA